MKSDEIIKAVLSAKTTLARSDNSQRNLFLQTLAKELRLNKNKILLANALDIESAKSERDEAFIDRMTITAGGFDSIAKAVDQVANLPNILGSIYETHKQPSGITTSKMRVPLGVLLMIYESRPNVTIDAAALSVKSGNAIILKGGSETSNTNNALASCIQASLKSASLPTGSVKVLTSNARELIRELLQREDSIDLLIPRGSRRLLEFIRDNSRIPTLMHLEGNCHTYIDAKADTDMATSVVIDAKTQRFGTCNATESLLCHREMAAILPDLAQKLIKKGVEIRGDKQVCEWVSQAKIASREDWTREYLGPTISVKMVASLEEAIDHINTYGSGHTDAIITEDQAAADKFIGQVDSASVMHNTSTRLADGLEYGLGAEIGISTGKLHARGPVGLEGLTTYKWIVRSNGGTKG